MFTIERITIYKGNVQRTLLTDTECRYDPCEAFATLTTGFFRLTEGSDAEEWNEFVREEWAGMDDCDFYSYAEPYLTDYDWAHYLGGSVLSLDDCENSLMHRLAYIRSAKELLG